MVDIPRSSSGRTTDSDSVYVGSNPARGSSLLPLPLIGKSADFESVNLGSSPRGASKINVDLFNKMRYIIYYNGK